MPWIIPYENVLEQMRQLHLKCFYYNSGAFGFPDPAVVQTIAWVGPDDSTIRPIAQPFIRRIEVPYEATLARLASTLWQQSIAGKVWLMPMSHWAFELGHGSHEWLPALVERLNLDPGLLENRNNAAAIEFRPTEVKPFEHFVLRLLEMLTSSDFMLAFPGRPVLCTLHHHKQLWWQTTDPKIASTIEAMVPRSPFPSTPTPAKRKE